MQIPKQFRENLKFRIELHQNCEKDEKARNAAMVLFKRNIVAFFNLCLFTYDPRKNPSDRPFILYDYQEKYAEKINQYIQESKSLLTEKSRDMGVTWIILGVFLYRWLFFDENYLVGSRKENLVDKLGDITSLFERFRYMINTMPQWILSVCNVDKNNTKTYMKLFKSNKASITGESTNQDFSRQGRYNAILLDEFASWDVAEQAWTACGDTAPSKFCVSTPKGSHNKFSRLKKSSQIEVETLHWHLHPEKDNKWYEVQKATRSAKDIAQELDINYTVSAGTPFYAGFIRGLHSRPLQVNTHKELILGWDYGWHHPCCVITQFDAVGRWCILDCIFGEKEIIQEFALKVVQFLNRYFPKYPITNYGDPAGLQVNDKSTKTSADWVEEVTGVGVISKPSNTDMTNYVARKNIIEAMLKQLIGGQPALMVNDIPRTQIIIEAFEGGWHYPEANKHGFVLEKPVKDGYYEHCINPIDYIGVNIFSPLREAKDEGDEPIIKVVGPFKDIHYEYDDSPKYSPAYRKIIGQGVNEDEEEAPKIRYVAG